jgi:hypothetical protein
MPAGTVHRAAVPVQELRNMRSQTLVATWSVRATAARYSSRRSKERSGTWAR